ncbi:hypothetical protein [Nocardioides campestrisoli]|uniref:hypothetical protein n=1 Tax=Nocardioides campestrisoli TaxID=2736757 RepID=UPI00163D5086|nr:hypothetical protein [Nocardioides campestrisoli]
MALFDRPSAHADEARKALRQLAHATRHVEDPTEIYPVLGELTNGLASLAQSLHQIAQSHDRALGTRACVAGDARTGRAASYQVAWELHRAAEMVQQVANGVARAHEVEATIAYDVDDSSALAAIPRRVSDPGLSL